MLIDESLMIAEVYYKKPGKEFYLVKFSIPDIGLYITSIVVSLSKNPEDGLYVKPPHFPYKGKDIKHVEFDSNGAFWKIIEPLALQAVRIYGSPHQKDEVFIPTDEELNNPGKLLDDVL